MKGGHNMTDSKKPGEPLETAGRAQIQLSKALDLLNLVAAEEALDGPEVLAVLEDMLGPEWAAAALPAANKEG